MQENLGTIPAEPVLEPASEDKDPSSMTIRLPLRPAPAYLAIAHSPSIRAAHPRAQRKLLILDLNGTLLLRPKPRNARHRAILPRPYMPSFRSYLFHEAVKPWLEVMVWSSAQPHNVNSMVERCFEDRRGDLKAVWARDTLGLTEVDYSASKARKVQTTKDLEKHWSALPTSPPLHSAETTLLLDDSALKAHLQPYNHFCVPEYTQNLRNRDLSVKETIERREELVEAQVETQVRLESPSLNSESILSTKKKRKRKKCKAGAGFDPTLIAVMGVLDEVKDQTNVAGWVRAGGLWAGRAPPPSAHGTPSFELFSDDAREGYGSDHSVTGDERRTRFRTEPRRRSSSPDPGNDAVTGGGESMWFDHAPCFQYWVDRGTHALEALGIGLDHGILR